MKRTTIMLEAQQNSRTGRVSRSWAVRPYGSGAARLKLNPLIRAAPAANISRPRQSQIFSYISLDGTRKALMNKAYRERMHRMKVTGLASSINMPRTSHHKSVYRQSGFSGEVHCVFSPASAH